MSGSPSADMLDPSLLMGGSESGTIPATFSPLVSSLVEAWKHDPRALWSSFAMIIFSEIGDKTFLIAAILSMRHARSIVFLGSFASLAIMSVLSSLLGVILPSLLPRAWTTLLAAVLFFAFGARMLQEAWKMKGDEMEEEWHEAQREIQDEEGGEAYQMEAGDRTTQYPDVRPYPASEAMRAQDREQAEAARGTGAERNKAKWSFKEGARNLCGLCVSPVFAQAFVLTFLGEWGDRSQIATIALAAAHNVTIVCLGTVLGHACCTSLAVLGGSWLASRISVRHVTLGGSILFLVFGGVYLFESVALLHADPQQLGAVVAGGVGGAAQLGVERLRDGA
ncbi:GCR1-dependent translation factor 1 [Thecaphora frezii]